MCTATKSRMLATIALVACLTSALMPMRAAAASPVTLANCGQLMAQKYKSRGPCVAAVQQILKSFGYDIVVDEVFGPITDRRVRDFQARSHIQVDGVIGPVTRAALLSWWQTASVPTPSLPALGPSYTWDCGTVTCSLYLSKHTTARLAALVGSMQKDRNGRLSQEFGSAGMCLSIGLATAEVGGAVCELLSIALREYATGQIEKAGHDQACLRVRVPGGLYVVNQNSAGHQFCRP